MDTIPPPLSCESAEINIRAVDSFPAKLLIEAFCSRIRLYNDKITTNAIFRVEILDNSLTNSLPLSVHSSIDRSNHYITFVQPGC